MKDRYNNPNTDRNSSYRASGSADRSDSGSNRGDSNSQGLQYTEFDQRYHSSRDYYSQDGSFSDDESSMGRRRGKNRGVRRKKLESLFVPDSSRKMRTNRSMFYSGLLMIGIFLFLIGYLVKFTIYDASGIITSPYNKRTSNLSEKTVRGSILSANGKILAQTETDDDGTETRSYPYENMCAHVVGYATHGKSGLESAYNYDLLTSHTDILDQFKNGALGEKSIGDSLITTIDTRLQKAAYEALEDHRGAVIVMEPSTGKIRAMVSKPDFDPNEIDDIWDEINSDETSSVLVNRAVQGMYPPGSTYKLMTALGYIQENSSTYNDFRYTCEGETIVNSVKIHCYNGEEHGKLTLRQAFAESCNTAFATIGTSLNQSDFYSLNENCLFNTEISFDLKVKKSRYKLNGRSDRSQIPQTAIGQGDTLMTPFHNLLLISAVANDGELMKPRLADYIESVDGHVVKSMKTKSYKRLMSQGEASILQGMLREVVTDGTAEALDNDDYKVYGKTGTAENENKKAHAWFIGYSETEDQADLAVCVLVENSGKASKYAVPIAHALFESYYNNSMKQEYSTEESD